MIVIQLESGKTRGFTTAQELGVAIRRGELGPATRIYHRTSDRWLPLSLHPEYRRAEAEREQVTAKALQRRHWTFLPREASTEEQTPGTEAPAATPPAAATTQPPAEPKPGWLGSTLRRLRSRSRPPAEQA